MADAFYIPDGDRFAATQLTAGPWDAALQHAGPPAALLAREISRLPSGNRRRIARITCDILRPIRVAPVSARARIIRAGATVDLAEAVLTDADTNRVMLARAWRLPDEDIDLPGYGSEAPRPAGPEAGREQTFFPVDHSIGYHTATEWRFTRGAWLEPGPAMAWTRMLVPLVTNEEPSQIERILVAADSASGVSAALDPTRFIFMNVDLAVQLARVSRDEWIGLDARSDFAHSRIGFAGATVFDRNGVVATSSQTLLVSVRTFT